MTLRSGKEVEGPKLVTPKDKNKDWIEKELEEEGTRSTNPEVGEVEKQDKEKEILEAFRKVAINIPLLDTIKQVPKYAKFLKNLCVKKKKLRGDKQIVVGENASMILQRKLPPKCGDPDMFIIPYKIRHSKIKNVMLDLGASINVMPKSIYNSLNLGPLKEIGVIIQLTDHIFAYLDGVIEDVLVQVDELIFSVDFYVLYTNDRSAPNLSPIILGRTFLSTTQTKIDVSEGTLTIEFDGEVVHFNIFDTMIHPVNSHFVFAIHAIYPFV
ncbi:uncharacterized protein [Coffea arabica]|uniref:Aspartic peptidase DDI1-type domain-containing protein n=1 Tax=Coffea arabica TaxID=13443 RepID=A0A6P6T110_COFAR|nr:uncharacterized protein LOC113696820 [Coffea arabica]